MLGVGQELAAQIGPGLAKVPVPLRLQPWVLPAGDVLPEDPDQLRIGIDLPDRSFHETQQAGIDRGMVVRLHGGLVARDDRGWQERASGGGRWKSCPRFGA